MLDPCTISWAVVIVSCLLSSPRGLAVSVSRRVDRDPFSLTPSRALQKHILPDFTWYSNRHATADGTVSAFIYSAGYSGERGGVCRMDGTLPSPRRSRLSVAERLNLSVVLFSYVWSLQRFHSPVDHEVTDPLKSNLNVQTRGGQAPP